MMAQAMSMIGAGHRQCRLEAVCHDVPGQAGRLICAVNPGILIHEPGKPTNL